MVKIASFNVNSIKVRLPNLLVWLEEAAPDIVVLQEIKCEEPAFPALELQAAGYHSVVLGQKTYNGVAILSRQPAEDVLRGLPGDDGDTQARYLEATVAGIRVAAIYLPNGNPAPGEKFDYKLAWMDRLNARARLLLETEMPVVLAGDYNVIPEPRDAYDAAAWEGDALFRPESRRRFRALLNLGYTDAFRAIHPERIAWTFWDYQAGRWPRDEGIRIDHLLLSPQAADRLEDAGIDKAPRGREKASDHTPIWCRLR
ncbi:MAG: exodeoxyribonuclease III [Thalassobaculales bacterium]